MAERVRRTQKEILRDKIVKINGELEKAAATVKRLKAERSQYEKELEDLEISQLTELMKINSVTVEDIQALVERHLQEEK